MPGYGVRCKTCGYRGVMYASDRRMLELGISSLDQCPGGHKIQNPKEDYEVIAWSADPFPEGGTGGKPSGGDPKVRGGKRRGV